jgi:hypothetical protein
MIIFYYLYLCMYIKIIGSNNNNKLHMSKTLEDYRNIVKILKLELLKLRVEN